MKMNVVTSTGEVVGYTVERNVYTPTGILRGRIDCVEYLNYKSVHFCAPFAGFLNRAKLTVSASGYIISHW